MVAEVERQQGHFAESTAALAALPIGQLPADDIRRSVIEQIRDRSAQRDSQPAEVQR